LTPRKKGFEF